MKKISLVIATTSQRGIDSINYLRNKYTTTAGHRLKMCEYVNYITHYNLQSIFKVPQLRCHATI